MQCNVIQIRLGELSHSAMEEVASIFAIAQLEENYIGWYFNMHELQNFIC